MQIAEVMTANPVAAEAGDSMQKVAQLMATGDFGSLPILDGGRLVGVVTDRDIAVRGVAQSRSPDTAVREVMSMDPVCIDAAAAVEDAAALMQERQLRRLYVTDQGSLVGVVAMADVARQAGDRLSGETIEAISQ